MAKLLVLEGLETFAFEGVDFEAFYTSGGVGTLIDTLVGEDKTVGESNIAYKTIRYPGHRDLMKFLLQDLRPGDRARRAGRERAGVSTGGWRWT